MEIKKNDIEKRKICELKKQIVLKFKGGVFLYILSLGKESVV